jgi:hypothetical protein
MWLSSTLSWVVRRKGPSQRSREKAKKQDKTVARKRSGRMAVIEGGRRLEV